MRLSSRGKSSLTKPLTISLLLHVGLIIGFYNSSIFSGSDSELSSETLKSIKVLLVAKNPQVFVVKEDVEELTEDKERYQSLDSATSSRVEEEGIGFTVGAEESIAPPILDLLEEALPNEEGNNRPAFNSAGIANSISTYMSSYSKVLNNEWLRACLKYQNEYGTKDCPQGRRASSPNFSGQANRRANIANFETLQALVNEHGVGGGLNELKQHYYYLSTPKATWTPQKAADRFNPNLLDSASLNIIDANGGGLLGGVLSLFLNTESFELESLVVDDEMEAIDDTSIENGFVILPALFRSR